MVPSTVTVPELRSVATTSLLYLSVQAQKPLFLQVFFPNLASPDDEDPPSQGLEFVPDATVARDVLLEFRLPELPVVFGNRRLSAPRMSMPETPMHEDYGAVLGQDDVRRAGQVLPVEPETVSVSMKPRADDLLRRRVLRSRG